MDKKHKTIDTTNPAEKWRWKCPECGSTNWRAHNGTIGCRKCDATVTGLVNDSTEEYVERAELEFVGPQANHKAIEALPPGKGEYR